MPKAIESLSTQNHFVVDLSLFDSVLSQFSSAKKQPTFSYWDLHLKKDNLMNSGLYATIQK